MTRPIGIPSRRRKDTLERALGAFVTKRRIALGLSQAALAEMLGYSASYISKLERGEMNPTLRTLFDIADALDVGPDAVVREVKRALEHTRNGY